MAEGSLADPANNSLQSPLWRILPIDLVHVIVEFYAFAVWVWGSKLKERSDTSLPALTIAAPAAAFRSVGKQWRPVLFESLTLRDVRDVEFLEQIVRSDLSGWLRDYIHAIQLLPLASGSSFREFYGAWASTSTCLTRLSNISFGSDSMTPVVLFRRYPSSLRGVTRLSMEHLTFPSFSTLYRELSALPNLKELHMRDISWLVAFDPNIQLPPSTSSAYGNITSIMATSCDSIWPFAWIPLVSKLADSSDQREKSKQALNGTVHADIQIIGQVTKLFEELRVWEYTSIHFYVRSRSGE